MDILNNKITLKSVYGKTSGQTFYICPVIDPHTGQYPPHIREVDENGRMILSEKDKDEQSKGKVFIPADKPIAVKHNTTFDLDNALQSAQWEAIKNSPLIAPERDARDSSGNLIIDGEMPTLRRKTTQGVATDAIVGKYGLADLYIERPGREAKMKNERRKLVHDAQSYIYDDSLDGLVRTCKLLEKDMSRANSNDIMDYLLGYAEKNPEQIIDIYKGPTAPVRLMVIDAMEKHVIIKRDKWLMYADNVMLGLTVDQAVEYLVKPDNVRIKEMIHKETYPHLYETKATKAPKAEK